MVRDRAPSRQTRAIIAQLLATMPGWTHGYELARATGCGSGTLYPVLIRLLERGLVEDRWVPADTPGRPARHAYRLTPAGVAFAREAAATVAAPAPREQPA